LHFVRAVTTCLYVINPLFGGTYNAILLLYTIKRHCGDSIPLVPALLIVSESGQTRPSFNGPGITLKKPRKPARPVYKVLPYVAHRWLSGSAYENSLA